MIYEFGNQTPTNLKCVAMKKVSYSKDVDALSIGKHSRWLKFNGN
jgi:hypothetical protein